MLDETAAFTSHVVLEGDDKLATLLTSTESFAEGPLRCRVRYRSPRPLDRRSRSMPRSARGSLTQASFLAAHAHANQSAPVQRGKAIRANLLCDAPRSTAARREHDAARSRARRHHARALRRAHEGAALRRLPHVPRPDWVRLRALRCDRSVLASATRARGRRHGRALRHRGLPTVHSTERWRSRTGSRRAIRCGAASRTQWLQYALGRGVGDADRCSLAQAQRAFADADYDIAELLIAITIHRCVSAAKGGLTCRHDQFRYRRGCVRFRDASCCCAWDRPPRRPRFCRCWAPARRGRGIPSGLLLI